MCIRDRHDADAAEARHVGYEHRSVAPRQVIDARGPEAIVAVSYTHLRAHETVLDLVCRLLLEKKKTKTTTRKSDNRIVHRDQYVQKKMHTYSGMYSIRICSNR